MYCKNCGNKLNEGASFCSKCGTSLNAPLNIPTPKKKSKIWILFVILGVFFISIPIILLLPSSGKPSGFFGWLEGEHYIKNKNDLIEYLKEEYPNDSFEIISGPNTLWGGESCFYYKVKSTKYNIEFKVSEYKESTSGLGNYTHYAEDNYVEETMDDYIKKYSLKAKIDEYGWINFHMENYKSNEELADEIYDLSSYTAGRFYYTDNYDWHLKIHIRRGGKNLENLDKKYLDSKSKILEVLNNLDKQNY